MSLFLVREILSQLPWSMRTALEGYVASVEAAKFEIFSDTDTEYNEELYKSFIFLVAVQRLWSLVDTQFWILSNSLSLLKESGAQGLQVGSTEFHTSSEFFKQLRKIRNGLDTLITQTEVSVVIKTRNARELLITLRELQ